MSMFAITRGGAAGSAGGGGGQKPDDIRTRTKTCISALKKSQIEIQNHAKVQRENYLKVEEECKKAYTEGDDDKGDRLLDMCTFYNNSCLQYEKDALNITKKICELERQLTMTGVNAAIRDIRDSQADSLHEESLLSARTMLMDFARLSKATETKTNMISSVLSTPVTERTAREKEILKERMMDRVLITEANAFKTVPDATIRAPEAEDNDEKELNRRFQALKSKQ